MNATVRFRQLEKRTDATRDHHADEQAEAAREIKSSDGRVGTDAILAGEHERAERSAIRFIAPPPVAHRILIPRIVATGACVTMYDQPSRMSDQ